MLKLIKYELRKAMTSMLILLGSTLALEGYFLYGLHVQEEHAEHLLISIMLLILMSLAVYIFVLVRGVASYSGELKSRSSYLIFMTPNSTRKIMASKFLFTLLLCILFGGLYMLIGIVDFRLVMEAAGEYEAFLESMNEFLLMLGVHTDQIIIAVVFTLIYMALSMLSFFAVAYLAITLSHTLFRDKKWRWIMALLFYLVINYALSFINSLFPMVYGALQIFSGPDVAVLYGTNAEAAATAAASEQSIVQVFSGLLVFLIPQAVISLGAILGSLFGCAWMLEKKVSL